MLNCEYRRGRRCCKRFTLLNHLALTMFTVLATVYDLIGLLYIFLFIPSDS